MSPQRIQRRRTKGWRMPENTVYVGRGSKWGNPFTATVPHGEAIQPAETRLALVDMYEAWIINREHSDQIVKRYRIDFPGGNTMQPLSPLIMARPDTREIRAELAGKNLACWCPLDQPCHADVLLELANGDPK